MVPSRPKFRPLGWVCESCASRLVTSTSLRSPLQRWASTDAPARRRLPDSPARTRFAPSPTGSLHLGSIRTALFNYLLARRTKGQFILRIEDTDRKRTVPGAEEQLYKDLRWAGLNWDEGPDVHGPHSPYKQSQRNEIYHSHASSLLTTGTAYRCFCTAERLDKLNRSRHERGLPLGYDRYCSEIPLEQSEDRAHKGESYVIRFRVPKLYPQFHDIVYGKTGQGSERVRKLLLEEPVFDDPILIKSDGFPTYHLANIVDDRLMEITHVIRGSEWISSTPLHVALYEAFGWRPPAFAHVPLLVDKNGQKLSKRNFNSDISSFRDEGIFPEALTNFAALLGWSHQQDHDVMDLKRLEENFDLKITKGNTIVAFEKLHFLQEHHAKRKIALGGEEFEQMIRDVTVAMLSEYGAASMSTFIGERKLRDVVASLLKTESLPYRSATQFAKQCGLFFSQPVKGPLSQPAELSVLESLRTAAAAICLTPESEWSAESLRASMTALQPLLTAHQGRDVEKKWRREFYHYLRWALLGGKPGPSLPQTMEILGKNICVRRIQSAALQSRDLDTAASSPHIRTVI